MFGNQGNNQGNNVNVNTNFSNYYGDNYMLKTGGWNTQLSVKMCPVIGENDGIKQYAKDTNQIIIASISQENAKALLKDYSKIEEAIKDGTSASTSIITGSEPNRKIITIGYDGNAHFSVGLNLNESNIPALHHRHNFKKKEVIVNYNPSTGSGERKMVEAEFETFIDKIKACKDFTPTVQHGTAYAAALKAAFSNYTSNANQNNGGYNQNQPSIESMNPVSQSFDNEMPFMPYN